MDIAQEVARYAKEQQATYRRFALKVEDLVKLVLGHSGIAFHSVTSREKSPESLREKIAREGKNYQSPLAEVTDLAGVRVITYFPTEIDKIVTALHQQFVVDKENSIDKRRMDDPAAFGYSSVHLVVWLTPDRLRLPEYVGFQRLRCEIQVRTILQHAWAEIEHSIVYKSAQDIPFELRRKFASLAGLLEVADREFEMLRLDEARLRAHIQKTIEDKKLDLPLNLDSLTAYLRRYHKTDTVHGLGLDSDKMSKISNFLQMLRDHDVNTIAQLHQMLSAHLPAEIEKDWKQIVAACEFHEEDCIVRSALTVAHHLKIPRDVLAEQFHCPAMGAKIMNPQLWVRKGQRKVEHT